MLARGASAEKGDAPRGGESIDRHALVTRHNPSFTAVDPSAPLMVGNGNLAMTADITGLAGFQSAYSPLVPLMIQAQWAWHSFPNPEGYRYEQSLVPVDVYGKSQKFPWLQDSAALSRPDINWLRQNPHRFSLGRLSFVFDGKAPTLSDLRETRQTLDLWNGRITSRFVYAGSPVVVETSVHPTLDAVIVQFSSPLLEAGRLAIEVSFPGVAANLNPDPADWLHPAAHRSSVRDRGPRRLLVERQLDATRYWVEVAADNRVQVESPRAHAFRLSARSTTALTLVVAFSPERPNRPLPAPALARAQVAEHWEKFWTQGGVIDFSGSTDPRAAELERRVVLSQYLTAVNAAGKLPPQEEGLFSNSWNGKFHLEMHPWHAAHFATWGRAELLERSMGWYLGHLPAARASAGAHGVRGAWWPKMVGPEGRESPSLINPFILWQQPHPIYLAELLYRAEPTASRLARYRELVFATADLLASLPHYDKESGRYLLGPPVIPAQEVFPPLTTFNPTFELEYFRFALVVAQKWRERLGLPLRADWQRVVEELAPAPAAEGLYLATESAPELWNQARSSECAARGAPRKACLNRDHPSFLGALGLLPGTGLDPAQMRRTLLATLSLWDLRQTWGWDYPLLAMTAARLHDPERALDLLLSDAANFQFGRSGMTPRLTLVEGAGADKPPELRRVAETYFPSNGSLLLAVGMMAAGWDGELGKNPGFPKNGQWRVQSEGLRPLP
jgi:hypothetical protein